MPKIRWLATLASCWATFSLVVAPARAASDDAARALAAATCISYGFARASPPSFDARGRQHERVAVTAFLSGGRRIEATYPYDWVYGDPQRDDPFDITNRNKGRVPIVQQRPPHGFAAPLPTLVAYILTHTDRQGSLQERPCPIVPAPPTELSERIVAGIIRVVGVTPGNIPIAVLPYFNTSKKGDVRVCASFRNLSERTLSSIRIEFSFLDASGTTLATETIGRDVSLAPGAWEGAFRPEGWVGKDDLRNCVAFETSPALRGRPGEILRVRVRATSASFVDGSRSGE